MGIVYNTICQRRSIRRFKSDSIPEEILLRLLNAARLAPSGSNIQPLEFILVNDQELVDKVFPCLRWAGYIAPSGNPPEGEQPVAYIIVLIDVAKRKKGGEVDAAAAIENSMIAAWEEKIGTCWIKSIDQKPIKKLFRIPHHLFVDSVVALGYSNEQPVLEVLEGSVKYWKDDQGVLHVPKRNMEDICHQNGYGVNHRIIESES
jgi:nitroreductase